MDSQKFRAGMAMLWTLPKQASVAQDFEELVKVYWLILRDEFTDEEWQRAVSACLRSERWFPVPVTLLEAARGSVADTAELAWMTVTQAVEAVGAYRTANFDDPLINATIRALGGWVALCDTPAAEFDRWTRKEFLRAYGSLARSQGMSQEATKALPGIHDRVNAIVSPGYGVKVVRVACGYINGKPQRIENAQN